MSKILKILTIQNSKEEKFLRTKSDNVLKEEIKSKEFQNFLDDLINTAQEVLTEDGYMAVGLAAVQVGVLKNVFCILDEHSEKFLIMINPEITTHKPTQILGLEGCLSVPGKEGTVSRYKKIKVKYMDRNGVIKRKLFTNQEAREIQHEFDHTQGILFIDKLVD